VDGPSFGATLSAFWSFTAGTFPTVGLADPFAFHSWGTALLFGAFGNGLALTAGDVTTCYYKG
jgi:hypothetical protein